MCLSEHVQELITVNGQTQVSHEDPQSLFTGQTGFPGQKQERLHVSLIRSYDFVNGDLPHVCWRDWTQIPSLATLLRPQVWRTRLFALLFLLIGLAFQSPLLPCSRAAAEESPACPTGSTGHWTCGVGSREIPPTAW